jgi:hypothetical protein
MADKDPKPEKKPDKKPDKKKEKTELYPISPWKYDTFLSRGPPQRIMAGSSDWARLVRRRASCEPGKQPVQL